MAALLFILTVTVSPKICNVMIIGICSSLLGGVADCLTTCLMLIYNIHTSMSNFFVFLISSNGELFVPEPDHVHGKPPNRGEKGRRGGLYTKMQCLCRKKDMYSFLTDDFELL